MAKNKSSKHADALPIIQKESIKTDLSQHASSCYLEYSLSVVKGRAIPWIEDGLKPVQRRILYAMDKLALGNGNKPKKSARVVGDVIGKYHPHGDSAVYEAMVRTSQDFSLRYPLVVGEGNFGSRDGDGAAAMRYTEARLSAISDTFLNELDKGTVDWVPNYDNAEMEPHVLPARLPNILLNGGSGIGVGIATELPPHNLNETVDAAIAMLRNPKMTLDEVMQFIPGPDYPTGGQIISTPAEIRKAYAEKRGSIRVRARYFIEGEGTKNWKIIFYELPYPTSSQRVMEEVDALFNPKAKEKKGKKVFSPEQTRLKTLISTIVENYTDSSDKDNAIRLVFEPKSFKQDPQELINTLLAYTSLETNCPVNLTVVCRDRSPRSRTLDEILREWTEFRHDTVHRRTTFEHEKATSRLHILDGRILVILDIDKAIRIIRGSETTKEAKNSLMTAFGLSEIQAEDILSMRLSQLVKFDETAIETEIKKLRDEINRLDKLLASKTAMKNQVIKELEADKKTFGDERRSLIQPAERIAIKAIEEQAASDEPVSVAISERGWIRVKNGHQHEPEAFAFKTGDNLRELFKARLTDQVIFLDESGKSYSYAIKDLPSAKGGEDVPIATLADLSTKLAYAFVPNPSDKIVLASDAGYGFICKASDLVTRIKAGKATVNLDAGAKLLPPICFSPTKVDAEQTAFSTLSSNGRLLCYRLSEINEIAKGKGVALCGLDENAKLAQIALWPTNEITLQIEGLKKTTTLSPEELAKHFQNRSSSKKGRPIDSAKGRTIQLVMPANELREDE